MGKFDADRMLKAVAGLRELEQLIDLEAFPGMRKKDTENIRRHLEIAEDPGPDGPVYSICHCEDYVDAEAESQIIVTTDGP